MQTKGDKVAIGQRYASTSVVTGLSKSTPDQVKQRQSSAVKGKVNLDFSKQYVCGEEPSDSDDEPSQSSSSSEEADSPTLQLPQVTVANI